ncbi:DNA helicase IV [Propionibacterium cyclohexanicum]|uniref:DNA helicase IV n=1 Tax=Propionibacterium cyclohexanicum TaxID=64702 RepID=A0A1H9TX72_9ACTN|nr:AAA family ATPase [Propionibacterium cyclohexanicum]SES01631.1 DNA helicase IV [Propionibacterium cyclohexanicum]
MTADHVLALEQAHLTRSRQALRQMREDTASWESATAGNAVSTASLRQALYRRVQTLQDLPDVPLFFGRIDYDTSLGAEQDEICHIGRRHVSTEVGGDPLVIDWRAPLALPFYRASRKEPMGVRLRRRFGSEAGRLTAYEDEDLAASESNHAGISAILRTEIERPRSGPMRDIVATIQPEQDVLVRTELASSLAIQGAPGTGKTAVGLHRAAFLLYAYRSQLSRTGVLVVGPNRSFLDYIANVLPALGEVDATQETIDSLLSASSGVEVRGTELCDLAALKGDPRMAQVISRALWAGVCPARGPLAVARGSRTWRVDAEAIDHCVQRLIGRGIRYDAGRQALPLLLSDAVLAQMGSEGLATDDRTQRTVARSAAVKTCAKKLWPPMTARQLVARMLNDAGFLAEHANGILTDDEQRLLLAHKPVRASSAVRWTSADLALLDEANDQLARTPSLGHIIVDEAQDLSAMQLRALGRRASTGSLTLLGDLAQATTAWGSASWHSALAHTGKPEGRVVELTEGFRVPGEVLDYATRLLPIIAPGLSAPTSVRRSAHGLTVDRVPELIPAMITRTRTLLARPGTVGIIGADPDRESLEQSLMDARLLPRTRPGQTVSPGAPAGASSRLSLVPASAAKGLEFDHVLLVEPASIVRESSTSGRLEPPTPSDAPPSGAEEEQERIRRLRVLYICLSRAVTSLVIVHHEMLPAELQE